MEVSGLPNHTGTRHYASVDTLAYFYVEDDLPSSLWWSCTRKNGSRYVATVSRFDRLRVATKMVRTKSDVYSSSYATPIYTKMAPAK